MASTSDSVIYETSLQSEKLPEQFTSKQWLYITDSNNGAYNGQINIESSSLANSGRWLSYSEGLITIPVTMTFTGAAIPGAPFCIAPKAGWHHLIDSVEVQFGNMSVQQQTPFTNVLTTFKMLSSFSYSGLVKYGSLLNFWTDDYRGYVYTNAANGARGNGVSNNSIAAATIDYSNAGIDAQINTGLLRRLYTVNAGVSGATAVNPFIATSDFLAIRRSYVESSATTTTLRAVAVIRLEDISDFCKKVPLTKGGFLKLTLNTNTGSAVITRGAGVVLSIANAAAVSVQGRTLPAMVLSAATNEPNAALANNATLQVSIGNNGLDASCRLYVPAYTMTSEYEKQYLDSKPITEMYYQDAYQYTISGQASGASISQLLTNGIVDPQYLLVVPFVAASAANQVVSPLLSPFASEPATTSPVALGQFQVQLSGKNLFQTDVVYDWQEFMGEVSKLGLNGGQSDDLCSGLIGFDEWSSCYRYYVCDLSRGVEADKYIPKSVLVSFTNRSSVACDYLCFIVFNRKFSFRTASSEIIM